MPAIAWVTLLIVGCTIAGIAVGRWPLLRTNRTTVAVLGVALLLGSGAMSLEQSYDALDLNTLLLIFSLMLLNGHLYLAGFFSAVAQRVVLVARDPRALLAVVVLASGVLSALFLNDTVVLDAHAAGAGYDHRAAAQPRALPPGPCHGGECWLGCDDHRQPTKYGDRERVGHSICHLHGCPGADSADRPGDLLGGDRAGLSPGISISTALWCQQVGRVKLYRPLLYKSALVIPAMLVLFFAGVPVPLAAFLAAGVMLATRRLKPERVFTTIDWGLLVFFAGLFVITGSLEAQGWTRLLFAWLAPVAQAGLPLFALVTVGLSDLISNVPAVLLLQHIVAAFPDPQRGWLMLAAASTLAGNLTLLGSVANLIMAELAGRWNVRVTFGAYLRVGLPITALTLLVAILLI